MKSVCAVALAVTIVLGGSLALASGLVKLDPALQPYKQTSGVSGSINSIGSDSLRQGYKGDVTTLGRLGLTGEWASKPISLYGRNSASGTYGFFKEHTLKSGDYKDSVKEQPGSASVVQGVTVDRFAVGYSGIGYSTAGVRPVPLAETDGDKCYEADQDNAYAGSYPLSRFLYVYVNRAPGKA